MARISGDHRTTVSEIGSLVERLANIRDLREESKAKKIIESLGDDVQYLTEIYSEPVPSTTLEALALKNDWIVGQCFYVQALVLKDGLREFSVMSGQDIPAGTRLSIRGRSPEVLANEIVQLDLRLARGRCGLSWKIRSLDRTEGTRA